MIDVEVTNRDPAARVDLPRLKEAVAAVLLEEGITGASVSVAVVEDATIRDLNRRYLDHDYATDVLSFLLERHGDYLEGEVIVSAQTAARQAECYGWGPADELLLYVVHGALHLVGYDDLTPDDRSRMRAKERQYLLALGCAPRPTDAGDSSSDDDPEPPPTATARG